VHDLDAFLDVFGTVRRVFATAKYFAGHDQIEDSFTAMLDLDNGATINMTACGTTWPSTSASWRSSGRTLPQAPG